MSKPHSTAPGGVLGAWFNVIVCSGMLIAAPFVILRQELTGVDILIAVGFFAIGLCLEVVFIRALLRQIRQG